MAKKTLGILLAVMLVALTVLGLAACNNQAEDKYTIVYLGDSIAEALIGPSPLSERDNYGYYAIVGKTNGFNYYNHSVSGHKTSTGIVSGDGLLEVIRRKDENAVLMRTHIRQADMIHISVLGNNVLQYDLGLMMLEVADPQFEYKYANDGNTLINALENGSMKKPVYRYSVDKKDELGNPLKVEFKFPPTASDIASIVDELKALNPSATIVFQKVYNPFFEGSKHLSPAVLERLSDITDDGRFGKKGEPISTIEQIRSLADYLLGRLNGILDAYLAEHPGAFKVLDAREAFQRIVELDKNKDGSVNLGGDSLGRKLIYQDWTHPSNMGHAVIAGMTQDLLDDMKVSSPDALKNYKALRVEQINRLFKPIDGFDAEAAIAAVNSAEKYLDVTLAYFTAIEGYTPVVSAGSVATNNPGTSFASDMRFRFNVGKMSVLQFNSIILVPMTKLALNMDNSYAEFKKDGSVHIQIQTLSVEELLKLVGDMDLSSIIQNFDIEGGIDAMVEPMFPGFRARIEAGDLEGALNIINNGLGFNLTGLNYNDDGVKKIMAYVAENMRLPADILTLLPKDTVITLTFDSQYYIKNVSGSDGAAYKGIYISSIGANPSTQPYCVFDLSNNNKGLMELMFKAEFMNATVVLEQSV